MPSISQPFRVTQLPKISSLNNYAIQMEYLQVAEPLSLFENKINIGISAQSIAQYIVNPTPKLIYNLPIPSTHIVTACSVAEITSEENDVELQELWCYGLAASKNFSLNAISKPSISSATETQDHEEHVANQIQLPAKAISIQVRAGARNKITAVLENGLIQTYDHKLRLLKVNDLSFEGVGLVEHFTSGPNQDFMIVVGDLGDNKACFKLFELAEDPIASVELNSIVLEDVPIATSKFFYQFGKLYRLCNSKVSIYSLPNFQLQATTTLPFISDGEVISFKGISINRALVTVDNKIYLVDLLHNALLSERALPNFKTFQILSTAIIPGTSKDTNKTLAIGVSTKQGPNPGSALDLLNIDCGTGTLKDSLGKSFLKNENSSAVTKPLVDRLASEIKIYAYHDIFARLQKAKNLEAFDKIFFESLSITSDFYTERDRFLMDSSFLGDTVGAIFKKFDSHYPRALTYLLTHPLFPKSHTENLLANLRDSPRLFKQAVVTCPNLPLADLLQELFTVLNDELSMDISLRILQDFNQDAIKTEIKKLSKVDLHSFITFVTGEALDEEKSKNKSRLFQLLSLVLDAVGLFALETETLEKLSLYVSEHVDTVARNIELLELLDDKKINNAFSPLLSEGVTDKEQPYAAYSVDYIEL
ncbi:LAMI_0H04192g1_1 [Lachancea mirantina]|uniref:LAMI_0H04192g1_1 n=1 Tax=Lachancea mirantina TaxID=1230905 RepID=A0A1G4KES6_9SACH|nr:LAMI_0H04192g1_1 [Lachancea mirantina]